MVWIRRASDIVADLQQRSALIYWTDFLLSVTAAWTLAVLFFRAPGWAPLALLEMLGSAILFFRAGTFIHEIIHFRQGELQWFARAWNFGMGIPMLAPWIIYRNHIDHHSVRYFGTRMMANTCRWPLPRAARRSSTCCRRRCCRC